MTSHYRIAVVVNPQSANGRTGEQWPELGAAIRDVAGKVEVCFCEYRGHGTELARRALESGYDRIVSVGGDGTHNEVVNGFFDGEERVNPDASMAILPQGTASDFARTLSVSDTETALGLLTSEHVVSADVGRLTLQGPEGDEVVKHFLNVAHFGLGGDVAEEADNRSKAFGGGIPYFLASLRTFMAFEAPLMKLRLDDEKIEQACIDVILANGRHFGGGIAVGEEVRLNNGFLEVFVVGEMSPARAVASLTKLYGGTVEDIEDVQRFRAKRIWAESEAVVRVNADGEAMGTLPAHVAVVSAGLKLVVGTA